MPLPVEVGHADDLGRARGLEGDGIGEAASSKAGEHVERVRAGVDRHQVGRTAGRERSRGHARRRLQAGDLGRAAGIDCGQPGPGAIGRRAAAKFPSPRLSRTLTCPVSLLVTTRSSRPSPVVSTACTSETPMPDGKRDRKAEELVSGVLWSDERGTRNGLVAGVEIDRKRAVAGVADHQVVPAGRRSSRPR